MVRAHDAKEVAMFFRLLDLLYLCVRNYSIEKSIMILSNTTYHETRAEEVDARHDVESFLSIFYSIQQPVRRVPVFVCLLS